MKDYLKGILVFFLIFCVLGAIFKVPQSRQEDYDSLYNDIYDEVYEAVYEEAYNEGYACGVETGFNNGAKEAADWYYDNYNGWLGVIYGICEDCNYPEDYEEGFYSIMTLIDTEIGRPDIPEY